MHLANEIEKILTQAVKQLLKYFFFCDSHILTYVLEKKKNI